MTRFLAFALALAFVLAILAAPAALAQALAAGGGAFEPPAEAPLSEAERAEVWAQIRANRALLTETGMLSETPLRSRVEMGWPLRAAETLSDYGYHGVSNFVDQDPAFPNQLRDYACGARTYDVANGYNHAGTDYFTWPFGWDKLDRDAVEIVAAAPGTIVFKSDGNFDRSCTLGGGQWNAVYVEHADGSVAWYGHMKDGSPTPKGVGEAVEAGEYLGIVGSSGNSTGPHLHLEVYDADEHLIDPYAGDCNDLNPVTWWADQRPYYDSAINALMTHDVAPNFPTCPNTEDEVNARDTFAPGETAYFAAYYRDQLQGQLSRYRLRLPSGAVWREWTGASDAEHYAASYWYRAYALPDEAGAWSYEVEYEGET